MRGAWRLAALASCAIVACDPMTAPCVPDEIGPCVCAGGGTGTQRCRSDGTFGSCSCATCDGGACEACVPNATAECACAWGRAGVQICEATGWGTCRCASELLDGCVTCGDCAPRAVEAVAPIDGRREILRSSRPLHAALPTPRGILVAFTTSSSAPLLRRLSRDDGSVLDASSPYPLAISGLALRADRVEIVFPDRIVWLDPETLVEIASHALEPSELLGSPTQCLALEGCGLWTCMVRESRESDRRAWIVYDARGHLRAIRRSAPTDRIVVPGRLALLADGYVPFDVSGAPRPLRPVIDPSRVVGATLAGDPAHTLTLIDGSVYDLSGCGDDPSVDEDCLAPADPLPLELLPSPLEALASNDAHVFAVGQNELVELDLATRAVVSRAPAPTSITTLLHDPWGRALVAVTHPCVAGECSDAVILLPTSS